MIILWIANMIFTIFVWNVVYKKFWARGLKIRLQFLEEFAYAGKEAVLEEVIENRKRLPIPILEVDFQIQKGVFFQNMENTSISDFVYKRDIYSLLGNQRITRKLVLHCNKRGRYQIDGLSYFSYSTLYRKRYRMEESAKAELFVYAKRTDVSGIILTCEKMMGARQCEKKLYEDPFAFVGIREYTRNDSMRTINWKASAKTGELMVNTYSSTLSESVMIYLDVSDRRIVKQQNLIEDSISVAATLSQKLLNRGLEVGISVNLCDENGGEDEFIYLEPDTGKKQRSKIERLLTRQWEEEDVLDFEKILKRSSGKVFYIFISKNPFLETAKAIETFLGSTHEGLWVLSQEKGEKYRIETAQNLHLIKREVERC